MEVGDMYTLNTSMFVYISNTKKYKHIADGTKIRIIDIFSKTLPVFEVEDEYGDRYTLNKMYFSKPTKKITAYKTIW